MGTLVDSIARHLEITPCGVKILWCGLLFTTAFFRELAHHCTAYDEERTIARARLVQ